MTDASASNTIFAVFEQILTQFSAASGAELGAVVFALAYIYLVSQQNVWCWACGFISTALFTYVFWDVSLVFSMLLNVYYMVMAGYGFWQWTRGVELKEDDEGVVAEQPKTGSKTKATTHLYTQPVSESETQTVIQSDDQSVTLSDSPSVTQIDNNPVSESDSQLDIQQWPLLKQAKIMTTTALVGGLLVWLRIDVSTPLSFTLCLDAYVSVFSVVATYMVAHKIYHNWHYWIVINAAAAVLYYQYGLYFSSLLFVVYVGFSVHGLLEWRKALTNKSYYEKTGC